MNEPTDTEDRQLLKAYAFDGNQEAFTGLVRRYAALVHGIALRTTGSATLAEEVTQNTFTILARKAGRLTNRNSLGGWLVTTARLEAMRMLRTECRRFRNMDAYSKTMSSQDSTAPDPSLDDGLPDLDGALTKLSESDREVLILRFYQRRSYRAIGSLLGSTEEAIRKRVIRALHKLRRHFAKSGHSLSCGALATCLTTKLSEAAPVVSATAIAGKALATAASAAFPLQVLNTINVMNLTKQVSIAVVVLLAILTTATQWARNYHLRQEVVSQRQLLRTVSAGIPQSLVASRATSQGTPSDPSARNDLEIKTEELLRELIALFEKMNRYDSDAARELFYAKLRELDAREQFRAKDLPEMPSHLKELGASWMMVNLMSGSLAMFAAERDPEGVARLLLEDENFPRYRLDIALENWAKKDPAAALEWYHDRIEDGSLDPRGARETDMADSALGSLIAGTAQTDLGKAVEILRGVESKAAERALYRLAFVFDEPAQRRNLTEALDSPSDSVLRDQVAGSYAKALTETDSPETAWNYLNQINIPDQKRRLMMAEAILHEARRDFKASPRLLQWVGDHADWFSDSEAIRQALNHWRLLDRESADAWAEKYPHLAE